MRTSHRLYCYANMMQLNFKSFGQGKPLIILHGLFGMLDNWQTVAKILAQEYLVILIDQRNHGRSPHTEAFDYPILAKDLKHFMEDQGIYSSSILGHSMGGKVAMQFAADYPDMVDKLIIVDIGPQGYVGGHAPIFEALFALKPATLTSRKEAEEILSHYIKDNGIRQFLLKNLHRDPNGGYKLKMNLSSLHDNYDKIIGPLKIEYPIETPTLFIRGGASSYITDADMPLIDETFENYRIETVEGAGHWVHAQAPKKLISLVEDFLVQ